MRKVDQQLINATGGRPDLEGIINAIENGANIDVQNPENGATCLIETCWFGHLDQLDYLIKMGANPDIKDASGDTALSAAIRQDNILVALKLLDIPGINLALATFERKTVLDLALENGHALLIQTIQEKLYSKTIDGFKFETPDSVSLEKTYPNSDIVLKEVFDFASRQVLAIINNDSDRPSVTQFSNIDDKSRLERAADALREFTDGTSSSVAPEKKLRPKDLRPSVLPPSR